jgi:hypothetical protein
MAMSLVLLLRQLESMDPVDGGLVQIGGDADSVQFDFFGIYVRIFRF